MHFLSLSRFRIAAAAWILLIPPVVQAQRGGRGGGSMHGGSIAGSVSASRSSAGSSRGGSVSIFGIQGRSHSGGRSRISRDDRFFFPRGRLFIPFGFGFFPDVYYLDYLPYLSAYPDMIIDPQSAALQEVPWNTAEYAAIEPQAETYWLISLRDDNIILATDYWLEGSTLHYVTRSGKASSVDLSEVDLTLTRDLNRGRGLDFRLPRAKPDYMPQHRDGSGRPY